MAKFSLTLDVSSSEPMTEGDIFKQVTAILSAITVAQEGGDVEPHLIVSPNTVIIREQVTASDARERAIKNLIALGASPEEAEQIIGKLETK